MVYMYYSTELELAIYRTDDVNDGVIPGTVHTESPYNVTSLQKTIFKAQESLLIYTFQVHTSTVYCTF